MLEECGLAYNSHIIPLGQGAKKPAEFLKINPQGTIPVLVDPSGPGGKTVTINQAGAIILYLAEKTGKLLPKELDRRTVVYQWFMSALTDVQPTSMSAYLIETHVPKAPTAVAYFEESYIDLCKFLDKRLAESAYLAGSEPSIADIACVTSIVYRRNLIAKAGGLANLNRWIKDMRGRPAVNRVLASWV
jgi:GST-like protein